MTSIGGTRRHPALSSTLSARIRSRAVSRAKTAGAKGITGLMARFVPARDAGPRPKPLGACRVALPYPEPRGGGASTGSSRLSTRMPGILSRLERLAPGVETGQEQVRNKRQMASTAFQNFDQKANQLYNLLSSVMKAMNEMRMGTVRNML